MGGRPSIRGIWKHYFPDTHSLIYVVNTDQWEKRETEITSTLGNFHSHIA